MKKVISIALTLAFLLSTSPVWAENDEPKSEEVSLQISEELEALSGLGIIEYSEPDEIMTRGEFALVIYNMLKKDTVTSEGVTWEERFFGDFVSDASNVIIKDEEQKRIPQFIDVPLESDYYDAVTFGVGKGLLKGFGEGLFKPDDNITVVQAAKILLTAAGYENYAYFGGGWVEGYMNLADELKLTKNISKSANDIATVDDVAKMIYNMFDIRCMEIEKIEGVDATFSDENTDTFIIEHMGMDYIEGVLTDNGIVSVYGESEMNAGNILVGNKTVKVAESGMLNLVRDKIGRRIRAYYSIENETEDEMLYFRVVEDETIIIDASDFEWFENIVVAYRKGARTVKEKIAEGAYMIYNGSNKKSYTEDDFIFERGTIRLSKSEKNGNFDIIVIESYSSWYVENIDPANYILYNSAADSFSETDDAMLELKEAMEENTVDLLDAGGNVMEFKNMASGGVIDFYKSQKGYFKIYYTTSQGDEIKIKGIVTDDYGKTHIKTDDNDYIVASEYLKAKDGVKIELGLTFVPIFNRYGEIIWTVVEAEDYYDLSVNYLVRCYLSDEGDEKCYIKVINDKGIEKLYTVAEKVSFGTEDILKREDYLKYNPEKMYEALKNYVGLVAFEYNNKDEVTLLEIPYKEHTGEDRLQLVYDTNQLANRPKSSRSGSTYAVLASNLWLDAKSVLWKIPTDEADIKDISKYNMATISIFPSDATAYGHVTGYGINEKSMYARWNIYKDATNYTIEGDDNSFFIVTDVRDEVLASGELATIIDGYSFAYNSNMAGRTLYCTEESGKNLKGEMCNPAKNATSFYEIYNAENAKFYSVQKGDIIKYSYQSENIYPDTIAILYRAGTGEILESTGKYSSNYKTEKTNPFSLTYQYQNPNSTDPALYSGSRNFILGYAHNVIDNLLTVSTQDLKNNGYDTTKGNGTLIEKRTFIASGLRGVIIEYGGKNIKVTQTTSMDTEIKTYEKYGFKCDKILAVNAGATPIGTFIIREAE